jgi:autotransporter-associated beta strand protein
MPDSNWNLDMKIHTIPSSWRINLSVLANAIPASALRSFGSRLTACQSPKSAAGILCELIGIGLLAAGWLRGLMLIGLLLAGLGDWATPAAAANRIWTGALNGYWSEPGNWDPAGPPGTNDYLRFKRDDDAHRFMTNDIQGLVLRGLDFGSDENDHSYQLDGNAIRFTPDSQLTCWPDGSSTITINCPLIAQDGLVVYVYVFASFFDHTAVLHLNGSITVEDGALEFIAQDGDLFPGDATSHIYIFGAISGPGAVIIRPRNEGTVRFVGPLNNTLGGTMYLSTEDGGEIIFNKTAGYVVTNVLSVVSRREATLKLNQPNQFGPNSTILLLDDAILRLSGTSQLVGNLVFTNTLLPGSAPPLLDTGNTTCQLRNGIISRVTKSGGAPPIIQGRLSLTAGDHDFNVEAEGYAGLEIQAEILGAGGFTKTGAAALLLKGVNTFIGPVTTAEGIIDAYTPSAFGAAVGGVTLDGGGLVLRNVAIGQESLFALGQNTGGELPGSSLTVVGSSSWAGPVTLNTNLAVVGGDMTFTGLVSGMGGLGCFSSGTIRLGGTLANTYTGPTLVRSPLVEFAKPAGVKAYNGPLIVGGAFGGPHEARWLNSYQNVFANVTLFANGTINLNNFNEDFGPLTFNGGHIVMGTGELGIYGLVTVNEAPAVASISGRLGLPTGYREFRVADGSASPDLLVSATVLGPGHLHKTGLGQMTLTGANTYNGLTLLEAGTLTVGHPNGLGSTASGTIVQDGATLAFSFLNGPVPENISLRGAGVGGTAGALNVTGTAHLRNQFPSLFAALDLITNATIRVESGGRLTADGFISGIGPLTKTGFGSLVFSNANPNTYVGETLVKEGTLELRKPNNAIAVPGHLILGPATLPTPAVALWYQAGAMPATAIATINANSLLDLNGNNQTLQRLNLNDGGDAATGAGTLSFSSGGLVAVGSLFGSGPSASAAFSGRIGLPANEALTFAVSAYTPGPPVGAPELEVSALIAAPAENVNFERAGIYKSGGGELRLTGNNTFNGRVDVVAGTLTVGSGTALGTAFDSTFIENGASLALINGITINNESLRLNSTNSAALDNRGGHNTWTGPITLARPSNISVSQNWTLTTSGIISGPGNLVKRGAGTLTLGGTGHNTYAGETLVGSGILQLDKPSTITAVPGALSIGPAIGLAAVARNFNNYQIIGNIFVNRGGLLDLNHRTENVDHLFLTEGGDVETGNGTLILKTGGSLNVTPGVISDSSTIAGHVDVLPGMFPISVAAAPTATGQPDLDVSARITSAGGVANLQKTGAGWLRFGGTNTYTGTTTVSGGTLQLDGVQPQSPVHVSAARLQGGGTVGHITFGGNSAARLAPGTSPGILTTSNFNANAIGGGQVEIELNSLTVGSGYDQLNVRGTVNLTGLTLSPTLNFASAATDQFTIINNDGADAVTGTFTGLPQNMKLYIGGELFQISYTGGTGNDVVLTRLVTPPPPTLRIERASPDSVRLIWPTNDPAFSLQATTNLTGTPWVAATPLPTIVTTNHVVTNTISDNSKFYRLSSP